MKKGGEVLGKGTYGCVYDGKPIGKKTKNNKLVKLMIKREDWVKELNNLNKIKKIGNSNSIINESFAEEIIQNINSEDIKNLNECNFADVKKIYEIIYNQITKGIILVDIFNKNILDIKSIFKLSCELYITINKYAQNKLIHNDIKNNNIIYIPQKNKLYFIDFGLLTLFDNFEPWYGSYNPPEGLLFQLVSSKESKDTKNFFIKYFFSLIKDYEPLYSSFFEFYPLKDAIKDLEDLYDYYQNKLKHTSRDKMFTDEDKSKIDTYMLSFCLYQLYIIYYDHRYMNYDDDYNKYLENFVKTIIVPGLRFNNQKRLNLNDKKVIDFLKKIHSDN